MKPTIVLLSGPLACGKSVVSMELSNRHGFSKISSSGYLKSNLGNQVVSRENLQNLGDLLDEETDFSWVVNSVAKPQIKQGPEHKFWYVDAVRKARQIEHFKNELEHTFHVHLHAPDSICEQRYSERERADDAFKSYRDAILHPNEVASRSLHQCCDLAIDISDARPASVADQIFLALEELDYA